MSFYFVCFLFFKLFAHTHVVYYKFAYGARHSWKQPDVTSLKISCNILLACNSISVSLPIKYDTYLYIYVYIYYIYSLRNPFPGIVISFFHLLLTTLTRDILGGFTCGGRVYVFIFSHWNLSEVYYWSTLSRIWQFVSPLELLSCNLFTFAKFVRILGQYIYNIYLYMYHALDWATLFKNINNREEL